MGNHLLPPTSASVRARIVRLNESIVPGMRIRGWHQKPVPWRRARTLIAAGRLVYFFRRRGSRGVWNTMMTGRYPDDRGIRHIDPRW